MKGEQVSPAVDLTHLQTKACYGVVHSGDKKVASVCDMHTRDGTRAGLEPVHQAASLQVDGSGTCHTVARDTQVDKHRHVHIQRI